MVNLDAEYKQICKYRWNFIRESYFSVDIIIAIWTYCRYTVAQSKQENMLMFWETRFSA